MESLEWVVRRFSPLLLAQARYRIAPRLQGVHDPEDLVQRTWLVCLDRLDRIVPSLDRYTPVLLTFLSSTLLQTYRNLMRGAARRPAAAVGTGDESSSRMPAHQDLASGVVTKAVRAETRDAVSRAIEAMPEADREILVLRGIEQMSYAIIAAKLNATEGALRVRFHRALERMAAHLPPELVEAMRDP
jgi:RNA polymerase sigma-70 factor (ECF subfamily)